MFDSELYKISREATQSRDLSKIESENKQLEKRVLEIIKANSYRVNEDGIVKIVVYSNVNREEYETLYRIITSGKRRYFEDEYSLYLVENQSVDSFTSYNFLTFIWNSTEYFLKNRVHSVSNTK